MGQKSWGNQSHDPLYLIVPDRAAAYGQGIRPGAKDVGGLFPVEWNMQPTIKFCTKPLARHLRLARPGYSQTSISADTGIVQAERRSIVYKSGVVAVTAWRKAREYMLSAVIFIKTALSAQPQ